MVKKYHESIRKYCIEKTEVLKRHEVDAKIPGELHDKWLSDSFPRYCVLQKLLIEIERYVPADFKTFPEIKERLIAVIEKTEAAGLLPLPPTFRQVMLDEKNKLTDFMGDLREKDISGQDEFFFRKVLNENEKQKVWSELKTRGLFSSLDPHENFRVVAGEEGPDFKGFYLIGNKKVENQISNRSIKEILLSHGIRRVWELRESKHDLWPSVEMDVTAWNSEPYFFGEGKRYLFSDQSDWILFAYGDGNLTTYSVIGEWLIGEIKENLIK